MGTTFVHSIDWRSPEKPSALPDGEWKIMDTSIRMTCMFAAERCRSLGFGAPSSPYILTPIPGGHTGTGLQRIWTRTRTRTRSGYTRTNGMPYVRLPHSRSRQFGLKADFKTHIGVRDPP